MDEVRRLLRAGHARQAAELAARVAAESTEPMEVTDALLRRLAALLNLNRSSEYAEAVDQAFEAIRSNPDPGRVGAFHALAAVVAHLDGSLERCVTHMVRSSRALAMVEQVNPETASAWHNLAISYSYIGFHGQALAAMDQCRKAATAANLPSSNYLLPEIRVRLAVSLDHRGDTDGCVRVLRDVISTLHQQKHPDLPETLPVCDRNYFGYAAARLAVLGHDPGVNPRTLLDSQNSGDISQALHQLGKVCLAIQDGNHAGALHQMENLIAPDEQTFGAAELPRLRALAHAGLGDTAAAHAADRRAFALTAQAADRLRELFVEGVEARIDHEDLRRTVARYADQALTDPLTGLPNRRHLQQYTEGMARRGEVGAVGVLDLDEFKAVNTVHGHLSGDLVLQRVAGILARVMRREDFVARYGGDEFVLVLPSTPLDQAKEVGNRVVAAIASEDWDVLVPNTPISITMGWAELDGRTELSSSFELADRAMLQAKAASTRPPTSAAS